MGTTIFSSTAFSNSKGCLRWDKIFGTKNQLGQKITSISCRGSWVHQDRIEKFGFEKLTSKVRPTDGYPPFNQEAGNTDPDIRRFFD